MITHHDGKRYSVNYTVKDKINNTFVLSGVTDAITKLNITKDEAIALLHGECHVQGYKLIRQDEVEI